MSGRSIRRGSVRLHLENGGAGPIPLLLLHGLTFDARTFSALTARLPGEIEWWAADFRGHGNSDWTRPPYLYRDLIDDTIAVISDGIGKPVYLFGHSLGGAVALAVAAKAPDWVLGLIVSDNFLTRDSYAAAIEQPSVRALLSGLSRLASEDWDMQPMTAALAALELPGPEPETMTPLGDLPGNSPEFLSLWAHALSRCDPNAALMTLAEENFTAFEGEAYFERLQCPLLLLQADPELGGMLSDEDVEVARRIRPDLSLERFPGAGHFMHMHDPAPTARAIFSFIRGRPGPGRSRSRIRPAG